MMDVGTYIRNHMGQKFEYGVNDCVLFISRFWEPQSGKIFKVIKDKINIDQSNWPQSFDELQEISEKCGYKNVTTMHMRLMAEIGFKGFTEKQNGDVVIDKKTHALGLRWKGMGAFLSTEGIHLCQDSSKFGWRL